MGKRSKEEKEYPKENKATKLITRGDHNTINSNKTASQGAKYKKRAYQNPTQPTGNNNSQKQQQQQLAQTNQQTAPANNNSETTTNNNMRYTETTTAPIKSSKNPPSENIITIQVNLN